MTESTEPRRFTTGFEPRRHTEQVYVPVHLIKVCPHLNPAHDHHDISSIEIMEGLRVQSDRLEVLDTLAEAFTELARLHREWLEGRTSVAPAPTDIEVDPMPAVQRRFTGLSTAQEQGWACVTCRRDPRFQPYPASAQPMQPVGVSTIGQVFACAGECVEIATGGEHTTATPPGRPTDDEVTDDSASSEPDSTESTFVKPAERSVYEDPAVLAAIRSTIAAQRRAEHDDTAGSAS